ncbi:hypothetical protein AB0M43_39130 [Longispora sp. NPDC051575]|uniref:hypothetical protein n=1 Tax=Longispora sp. NPDC051575 TaxID=3154943 RepID=UPI00343E48F9
MSAVEVVVAALTAGVSAGVSDAVKGEIAGVWQSLRTGVAGYLGRGKGQRVLEAFEAEPDRWRADLEQRLAEAEFHDADLVEAARRIMAVVDPKGSALGKYQVQIVDGKGVQVGDGNTQHNTFS